MVIVMRGTKCSHKNLKKKIRYQYPTSTTVWLKPDYGTHRTELVHN